MSRIILENLNNTRDLGGVKVSDGVVAPGRLIRSGQLGEASEADRQWLRDNVSSVIDFRASAERNELADPDIEGVENIHIAVIDDISAGVSRDSKSNEEAVRMLMTDPDSAMNYMCSMYESFVTSETARSGYETFVRKLLEDRDKAILWHCTVGKDRAGFATVIALEMLGADRETIIRDYLATNEYIKDDIEKLVAFYFKGAVSADSQAEETDSIAEDPKIQAEETDSIAEDPKIRAEKADSRAEDAKSRAEDAMRYLFGARREFLDAAYSKAEELYGSFAGYIREGLHISEDDISAWKKQIAAEMPEE